MVLLYRHLYPLLLTFARKYLRESHYLAEDYVQNAILSAWRQKDMFTSIAALKSYLYNSIRNQTISLYRKEMARLRYTAGKSEDDEDLFHGSIVEAETESILYHAINSLPATERHICELSYMENLRIIDIAKLLNISDSTVKKRKAKALTLLRTRLAAYPDLLMCMFLL